MRTNKLSLLKKNYGLPLGATITQTASRPYYYIDDGFISNIYDYPATYELVDSDKLRLRRGDIVRISNFSSFRKNVRGEYGVILERYRVIKQKLNGTFKDYYALVLISTGKDKGQLLSVSCHRLSGLSKKL